MVAHAADEYYPFDAGAGQFSSEAQWRNMWAFLQSGVVFGVTNQCRPFADSTGLHFKVDTGQVNIKGHTGLITASFTTSDLASVAGLTAGLKRIDRLVARADFVNNKVEFDVLTGAANASPVATALTQNVSIWEIGLAHTKQLTSADATLAVNDVTDERVYETALLDTATQFPLEAWASWVPVVGGGWVRNNGTVSGKVRKVGRDVTARGTYIIGSTDNAASPLTIAGFPYAPTADVFGEVVYRDVAGFSGSGYYTGELVLASGTTTATLYINTQPAVNIDATHPVVPGVNDVIVWQTLTYET